jgi:glycosyltransferase involved in cell wall biosynthesis
VILPALDERGSVEDVVRGFAGQGLRVIVVDNGSRDGTGDAARAAGAEVVREPVRGYGAACLAGLRHLERDPPEFLLFADCDGSAAPEDSSLLLAPLRAGEAELVLGVRRAADSGGLPAHQRYGNRIVCLALRLLHGIRVCDVSPFRAATWTLLSGLDLRERTYGLPVETVVRAKEAGGRVVEREVRFRPRTAGRSKIAGSPLAAARAGLLMLSLCLRLRLAGGAER